MVFLRGRSFYAADILACRTIAAQSRESIMKRDDIVGVYRQLGEDAVNAAGEITFTNNERNSQIMYSPDGYIGVISAPAGRKRVSGSDHRTDLNGATAE